MGPHGDTLARPMGTYGTALFRSALHYVGFPIDNLPLFYLEHVYVYVTPIISAVIRCCELDCELRLCGYKWAHGDQSVKLDLGSHRRRACGKYLDSILRIFTG